MIKVPKINVPEGYALLIGVGVVGFIVLASYLKAQAAAAGNALGNINAGTPYDGFGVVGTLGNAVNQTLGGAPASIGDSVGGWLYDLFNPAYDPNADTAVTRTQALDGNFANDTSDDQW
jgi:hypothetical protein